VPNAAQPPLFGIFVGPNVLISAKWGAETVTIGTEVDMTVSFARMNDIKLLSTKIGRPH
jgi:hypothetical protein